MALADGFHHGPAVPALAFVAACAGAAVAQRAQRLAAQRPPQRRAGALALAAVGLGGGVWTAQAISLFGLVPHGTDPAVSIPLTLAALGAPLLAAVLLAAWSGYGRGPRRLTALLAAVLAGPAATAAALLGLHAMHRHGPLGVRPLWLAVAAAACAVCVGAAHLLAGTGRRGAASGAVLLTGVGVTATRYLATLHTHPRLLSGAPGEHPVLAGNFTLPLTVGLLTALLVAAATLARPLPERAPVPAPSRIPLPHQAPAPEQPELAET